MATKKTAPVEPTPEISTPDTPQTPAEPTVEKEENKETPSDAANTATDKGDNKPATNDTPQTPAEPTVEIPDYALAILKVFAHEPKLFIGKAGDTFLPGTPSKFTGTAVLYVNPYYKSKK